MSRRWWMTYTRWGAILGITMITGGLASAGEITVVGVLYTTSVATIDTPVNTLATQSVNTYSLELQAQMPGGGLLYDQFFSLPITDPTVQNAIALAESILNGAGAVSFLGPTLLSNAQSLANAATNTVQNSIVNTDTFAGTETFIGPQTILTGDFGVCQSYTLDIYDHATPSGCNGTPTTTVVSAGSEDIDTLAVELNSVYETTTTTNTYLSTLVYDIVGLAASEVPEPATCALIGVGLLAMDGMRYRGRQESRHASRHSSGALLDNRR
jgi:hypothetical protein